MSFLKCAIACGALIAVGVATKVYSDTNFVKTISRTYKTSKLKKGEIIKITHFTDLHYKNKNSTALLKRAVESINETNPDIVVYTGDFFDSKAYGNMEETILLLKSIRAPLGKYAVAGNHEHRHGLLKEYENLFKASGFAVLKNHSVEIDERVSLIGVDDIYCGKGDIRKSMDNTAKKPSLKIALCHEPDAADEIFSLGGDIVFSGHSHWGQVNVPIMRDIVMPPFCNKYDQGEYKKGDKLIYVGSGLGCTKMHIRFFSPASVAEYKIMGK